MFPKKIYSLIVLFTIFAMVVSACGGAAPTATEAPMATKEATEAAQPPAATEPAGSTSCPAVTLADMKGISAGVWPQQYEVAEFETMADCTMSFTGRTEYDARLVEYGFLPEGNLPSLEERLPEEPLVVVPYAEIGKYGGRISGASIAPEAGNSEWLSVRHVNLLRFADDLQAIVPNMAKSYEWNDDYTELTVTLRKGHKW